MLNVRKASVAIVLTVFLVVYFVILRYPDKKMDISKKDSFMLPPNIDLHQQAGKLVNSIITEYDEDIRNRFRDLALRKVSPNDPGMLALIREMMDPPSKHMVKTVRLIVETPQSKEIVKILNKKKGGFFVEAGGLDGERSSNTLHFEQKLGWTGLLVEMDPYFYTQLIGKSRRSWSINACISPQQHPVEMPFKESNGGGGQLVGGDQMPKHSVIRQVPCFPLESLLLAINRTRVDYFSLDVEGYELDVLKTVPFDRLDIQTLSVEYVHGRASKTEYRTFMEEKGYRVHKDITFHDPKIAMHVDDFIFIKG